MGVSSRRQFLVSLMNPPRLEVVFNDRANFVTLKGPPQALIPFLHAYQTFRDQQWLQPLNRGWRSRLERLAAIGHELSIYCPNRVEMIRFAGDYAGCRVKIVDRRTPTDDMGRPFP